MSSPLLLSRIRYIAGFLALAAIVAGVALFLPGHSITEAYRQAYPPPDATEPPPATQPPATQPPATQPPATQPPATQPPYPPPGDQPTVEPPAAPTQPADNPGEPASTAEPTATPVPGGLQPGNPGGGDTHSNLPPHLKTRTSDPITVPSYSVQPGDTLFRIATRAGTTVQAILAANGLRTTAIYAGQVLIIPVVALTPGAPGTAHSDSPAYAVHGGDTLYQIARRYGVSLQALMMANGLRSATIHPGQTLTIPTAAAPQAKAVVASSDSHAYVVQGGDTLFQIARSHGVSVQALMLANHMSGALIRAGQNLIIP